MSSLEDARERARRYLESAVTLIGIGDHESAISRSYYAMFYMARAALETEHLSPKTHGGVLTLFAEHFVKTGRISSAHFNALRNAFDERAVAEYGGKAVFTAPQAEQVLQKALAFVDEVERVLKSKGRIA